MIARIKALLRGGDGIPEGAKGRHEEDDLHLAAAALLVETACMDGHVDEAERDTITALLQSRFGLDAGEAGALIDAGHEAVTDSSQLYGFTRVIKDRFSDEERIRLIEMLWEVAYADGHVHHYESSLVRRVAGLIYVTDRDSGDARKRVLARSKAAS